MIYSDIDKIDIGRPNRLELFNTAIIQKIYIIHIRILIYIGVEISDN